MGWNRRLRKGGLFSRLTDLALLILRHDPAPHMVG